MAFRLIPRDEGFYPLFDEMAVIAADCARRLQSVLSTTPIDDAEVEEIITLERKGDQITREIRDRIERSLVTPFDREDIQELTQGLDDVIDDIRAAADTARLHHLNFNLAGVSELTELLVRACDTNVRLIAGLVSLKDVSALVDDIDQIEGEADAVYRSTIAELFSGSYEALDVLKWKDVVEAIEEAIDAVEDASDTVQAVAIKHA